MIYSNMWVFLAHESSMDIDYKNEDCRSTGQYGAMLCVPKKGVDSIDNGLGPQLVHEKNGLGRMSKSSNFR